MPHSSLGTRRAARTAAIALALAAVGATQSGTASAASWTTRLSPQCRRYVPQFNAAASAYGVPAPLLAVLAKKESGCDPSAVSRAGARGLFQMLPASGADLRTPATQTTSAAKSLASIKRQVGSRLDHQLAAWNAGVGAVKRYHGVPPFRETRDFVASATADYRRLVG
ncbi:lytic transglycosylase domain-containing protein [Streptomyces sp. NPDC101158]|uniref:lytic transglycosylase domain-containing protein n=1 Tax=Streptomyces sp. NPDC101158 TaxID=3366117 RepID=UPI0038232676